MLVSLGGSFIKFSREVSYSYLGSYVQGGNTSFRNFGSVDIGTASTNRTVVIVLSGYRATSFGNTVTINGVTATTAVQGGTEDSCGIYYAVVPTGTSVTVSVSSTTNVDTIRIFVHVLYNLTTLAPTYTSAGQGGGSTAVTTVSNSNPRAILICVSSNRGTAGNFSYSGAITTKVGEGTANATDVATGAEFIGITSTNLNSWYSGSMFANKVALAIWKV